ncbi:uncharacterized protein ACLA_069740 [Aspergillus clavatus NRRL 1]|uniref:Uncharacterized protein n=1 Tax=Aspergillus clavatus (strain ATCC 1007 / CBS 513.65 / DSM 816 / NCTC 3887 / NRRL 1 / QM 1276 / 107) TaxID=344612 RepID=A1C6C2_ASPCL|nr:uncharacterized protein ACLA_069740 [Aspergillus clavatus NRRL 1]EAW13943.1 conserved hypothetical protein [Aspergillus clavatus NRRL 1]
MLTLVLQRDNQIENLIPVLMLNEGIDCHEAMQLGFRLVQDIADAFHEVEASMRGTCHGSSSKVSKMFIEGCKNVAMGLTHWSYSGQRYFKPSEIGEGNVIKFKI